MSDFFETRHYAKTRKNHVCEYCDRLIPAGEPRYAISGKYEGDFQNYSLCPWCEQHIAQIENDNGSSYEFQRGGLYERVHDMMYGEKCPDCGDEDYEICLHTERGAARLTCRAGGCRREWELNLTTILDLEATT